MPGRGALTHKAAVGATIVRGRTRVGRLAALAGTAAATVYVGLVDPARGGAYPLCPSRLLLGLDCPACGGLRGLHDLLHGRLAEALGHNLLLPAWLAVLGVALGLWLLPPVARRPARALVVPPRVGLVAGGVLAAFTVARNVPVGPLELLASG